MGLGAATSGLTVALGLATALIGCEPMVVGDPLPGYIRVVSIPPQSTFPLTIRFRDPGFGGLSSVSFDFAADERILIVFPSMPSAPGNSALQLNDIPCEGTWSITSQVETDVLLRFDEASCRTDVVGSHAFGAVHTDPQTEANVDPIK